MDQLHGDSFLVFDFMVSYFFILLFLFFLFVLICCSLFYSVHFCFQCHHIYVTIFLHVNEFPCAKTFTLTRWIPKDRKGRRIEFVISCLRQTCIVTKGEKNEFYKGLRMKQGLQTKQQILMGKRFIRHTSCYRLTACFRINIQLGNALQLWWWFRVESMFWKNKPKARESDTHTYTLTQRERER